MDSQIYMLLQEVDGLGLNCGCFLATKQYIHSKIMQYLEYK